MINIFISVWKAVIRITRCLENLIFGIILKQLRILIRLLAILEYSCKNGTTSSLINHLKSKHTEVHQKFLDSTIKRPTTPSTFQQKSKQARIEDYFPVNEKV